MATSKWQHYIALYKSKQLEREHGPVQASKRSVKLRAKGCGLKSGKNTRIVGEKLSPELGLNGPRQ